MRVVLSRVAVTAVALPFSSTTTVPLRTGDRISGRTTATTGRNRRRSRVLPCQPRYRDLLARSRPSSYPALGTHDRASPLLPRQMHADGGRSTPNPSGRGQSRTGRWDRRQTPPHSGRHCAPRVSSGCNDRVDRIHHLIRVVDDEHAVRCADKTSVVPAQLQISVQRIAGIHLRKAKLSSTPSASSGDDQATDPRTGFSSIPGSRRADLRSWRACLDWIEGDLGRGLSACAMNFPPDARLDRHEHDLPSLRRRPRSPISTRASIGTRGSSGAARTPASAMRSSGTLTSTPACSSSRTPRAPGPAGSRSASQGSTRYWSGSPPSASATSRSRPTPRASAT